jgi:hypothetical protein
MLTTEHAKNLQKNGYLLLVKRLLGLSFLSLPISVWNRKKKRALLHCKVVKGMHTLPSGKDLNGRVARIYPS